MQGDVTRQGSFKDRVSGCARGVSAVQPANLNAAASFESPEDTAFYAELEAADEAALLPSGSSTVLNLSPKQRHVLRAARLLKVTAARWARTPPAESEGIRSAILQWTAHAQLASAPMMSLDVLLRKGPPEEWFCSFVTRGFPALSRHAAACAKLFPTDDAWPILSHEGRQSVALSRTHAGALIASMFLCSLPKGNPSFALVFLSAQSWQVWLCSQNLLFVAVLGFWTGSFALQVPEAL